MKVIYLDHSGILVELKDYYCIFDYYKGELPPLDKEKDVIVFCSHSHNDHYNPLIFDLLDKSGMCYQAVLANDISDENRLSKIKHSFVKPDECYQFVGRIQVETLLSNDSGVAFIVKVNRKRKTENFALYITRRLEKLRVDILMLLLFHLIQDWKHTTPMGYYIF